jgi:hypothetical protein
VGKNEICSECVHNVHLLKRSWQEAKKKKQLSVLLICLLSFCFWVLRPPLFIYFFLNILYYSIFCYIMLCYVKSCYVMLNHILLCFVISYNILYFIVVYCIIYHIISYHITLYYIINILLYHIILYYIILLYCIVLYCIVSYNHCFSSPKVCIDEDWTDPRTSRTPSRRKDQGHPATLPPTEVNHQVSG